MPGGVIVVQVCKPENRTLKAFDIGDRLQPDGRGHATAGLTPRITAGLSETPAYVYQHRGNHSYSPKNGWVYAIRRTMDKGPPDGDAPPLEEPSRIQIFWEDEDAMGTLWPFELDWYACDWPEDAQVYVRADGTATDADQEDPWGAPVPIPSSLHAQVMDFQEPAGHAQIVDDMFQTTNTAGHCLLKLTGADNVWFQTVRSVASDAPQFDTRPIRWPIGEEIRPHPTSVALELDGVDDYVDTGVTNLGERFTIEFWIKPQHTGGYQYVIDKPNTHWYNREVAFEITPAMHLAAWMNTGNHSHPYGLSVGVGGLSPGTWYHAAFTFDGSEGTLFLNGAAVSTATFNTGYGTPQRGSRALIIGREMGGGYHTGAAIDEVRIWDEARTAEQILVNKDRIIPPGEHPATLRAYFPFLDTHAGQAVDVTDAQHHADTHGCSASEPGAVGMPNRAGFSEYHGYIHRGSSYNVNLYRDPHQIAQDLKKNPGGHSDPGDDDPAHMRDPQETYIYGVNNTDSAAAASPGSGQLEIWWSRKMQQPDMPDPIWFPAWVQVFENHWAAQYPQIVLASQLGSVGMSPVEQGFCLDFLPSQDSYVSLPPGTYVNGDFTLEAWVYPRTLPPGASVLRLGPSGDAGTLELTLRPSGEQGLRLAVSDVTGTVTTMCEVAHGPVTQRWTHVAAVLSGTTATLYLDGLPVATQAVMNIPPDVTRDACRIGGARDGQTWNGYIDDVRIWNVARSADQLADSMHASLEQGVDGLVASYTFEDGAGTMPQDAVSRTSAIAEGTLWRFPGAPRLQGDVLFSDTAPVVYTQNDPAQPGYNPNDEHAFIAQGQGGYVTYALRDDLSTDPHVLVQYKDPDNADRPTMQVYGVVRTNRRYPSFSYPAVAGLVFPGPHPLDYLPDPWMSKTTSTGSNADHAWRDRKGVWWARSGPDDGGGGTVNVGMHYWYPMQAGFYFPSAGSQPTVGDPIPWLPTHPGSWKSATPITVTWQVRWPDDVPEMFIGETLIEARDGLPDIWNQLSINVLYQQSVAEHDETRASVMLIDPTRTRRVGLKVDGDTGGEALSKLGFAAGPNGNTHDHNGLTYFYGLPPDLSGRFYFDPNAGDGETLGCLSLDGQYVNHAAGAKYLLVNVLTPAQRDELKALVSGGSHKTDWDGLIDKLPRPEDVINADPVNPLDHGYPSGDDLHSIGGGPKYPFAPDPHDLTTRANWPYYRPVDHYALTSVGSGTGYVTLVFNDALPMPDPTLDTTNYPGMGVRDGDPISMQIIRVVGTLARNSVVPVEDPFNLLSDQMNMLFSETFAGEAGNFEFEWRYALPNPDGTTPTDPDDYTQYGAITQGLTRVRLGGQGSTLQDMVSRFFIVRYRGVTNGVARTVAGYAWSPWTEPMLAPGWVQRVFNAITPFEQRLRDLYTHAPETMVSMLREAGQPYEGDVALNMNNMENVGLIQLYQTVLNRAEALSLELGTDSAAANQQLLLAATRLNDLYMLLGNEAYADALDPMIGFGSDTVVNNAMPGLPLDYGTYASSLYCFDNQVPTLLDEELCLLRGRDGALAPGVDKSPCFNRLMWNFTKGITAGEVAYAMHYNVKGADQPIIDAETAAESYPQGHGDAWGHYLNALKGYYRLLKHPCYTWGDPAITPMLVADRVVDADYYDEEKFAESAVALVRTGAEIVDRTYRKAYTDSAGGLFPGYRDADPERAWGVGEWGGRTGLGALVNWACAASLLPPQPIPASGPQPCVELAGGVSSIVLPPSTYPGSSFTFEIWVQPTLVNQATSVLEYVTSSVTTNGTTNVTVRLALSLQDGVPTVWSQAGSTLAAPTSRALTTGEWARLSLVCDDTEAQLYVNGTPVASGSFACADREGSASLIVCRAFAGKVSDIRMWDAVRTGPQISACFNKRLNGQELDLLAYYPLNDNAGNTAADLARGTGQEAALNAVAWVDDGPTFAPTDDYAEPGVRRVDRGTVNALTEIVEEYAVTQRRVDTADGGLNPLGLADGAVPFDIAPGEIDAGKTHFEQIAERATTALNNAHTVFDHVQELSTQLRRQQESAYNFQLAAEQEERAFKHQLIEIFGYPYSDDIGPGSTYPQGYDGPDLVHFMYIDMESLGIEHVAAVEEDIHLHVTFSGIVHEKEKVTFKYSVAPNGMPVKPHEWSGRRRAEGSIQADYRTFLAAYSNYERALEDAKGALEALEREHAFFTTKTVLKGVGGVLGGAVAVHTAMEIVDKQEKLLAQIQTAGESMFVASDGEGMASFAAPFIAIAGMSAGFDPGAALRAGALAESEIQAEIGLSLADSAGEAKAALKSFARSLEMWQELLKELTEFELETHEGVLKLKESAHTVSVKARAAQTAFGAVVAGQERFLSTVATGQRILARREGQRMRVANRVASSRYTDMAFRIFRNDALQRYSSSFDLAAKYVFLAAKAYDYETGLLSTDPAHTPGAQFLNEIVKARTIGRVIDGVAQPGGAAGDPGLADCLARMQANWAVLKGRFGFNNPETETGRFSLRTELFRFFPDASGDENWRRKLAECRVDNLLDLPEFRRHCLPFATQDGLEPREPGIVIPFSSTIDFAKNFFGHDLLGGDNAYDSSHFATKVRGVGIWLSNYDKNAEAENNPAMVGLARQPRVYLVPVGVDTMRSPSDLGGELREWTVVDQTIPLPYRLGDTQLDDPDFIPLFDSFAPDAGQAKIRRYPALRAYHDNGFDESEVTMNSRLVGRSVWNSKWLLIIPAGALHSERDQALDWFINGVDGDGNGVKDIKILFKTYSYAGN